MRLCRDKIFDTFQRPKGTGRPPRHAWALSAQPSRGLQQARSGCSPCGARALTRLGKSIMDRSRHEMAANPVGQGPRASARVGVGNSIMDCSRCEATMTGRPSCRQRTTTSFCTDGTSSSGICAPAAPRCARQTLTLTLSRPQLNAQQTPSAPERRPGAVCGRRRPAGTASWTAHNGRCDSPRRWLSAASPGDRVQMQQCVCAPVSDIIPKVGNALWILSWRWSQRRHVQPQKCLRSGAGRSAAPRSPRATMTASDASTISARLGTESCDSTLAITSMTCTGYI